MSTNNRVAWIPGQTLKDIEREVIKEALVYFNGNRTLTARALQISIRTMRNKIHEFKLYGPEFDSMNDDL